MFMFHLYPLFNVCFDLLYHTLIILHITLLQMYRCFVTDVQMLCYRCTDALLQMYRCFVQKMFNRLCSIMIVVTYVGISDFILWKSITYITGLLIWLEARDRDVNLW